MQQTKAVLDALAAEARAIQRAEFDALPLLQQQIASLLSQMSAQPMVKDDLRTIKRQVDKNQSLLQAAIRGITAARIRMDELLQVQHGLNIYDQSGLRATLPAPRKSVEKKA